MEPSNESGGNCHVCLCTRKTLFRGHIFVWSDMQHRTMAHGLIKDEKPQFAFFS